MTTLDMARFFDDKAEWSRATFGSGDLTLGLIAHIRDECDEVAAAPSDLTEWVDIVLLAMDGAWRSAGANGEAFVAALVAKDAENRLRSWDVRDPSSPTRHKEEP